MIKDSWTGDYTKREATEKIPEKGSNVGIVLAMQRHGVRYPTELSEELKAKGIKSGQLMPEGVTTTQREIQREGVRPGSALSIFVDKIRVVGSPAGPVDETGEQRSLRTARIVAEELAKMRKGGYDGVAAPSPILSYGTMTYFESDKVPYDHEGVYDAAEKTARAEGKDVEVAASIAQDAALNAAFSSTHPNAESMKKEAAGAFAVFIEQMIDRMKNMQNNETAIVPAGTHGGVMEYLLQQAMIWTDEEGKQHGPGFMRIEEIKGAFMASEGYNLEIENGRDGKLSEIRVTFQDKARRSGIYNAQIDISLMHSLADYYRGLHKEIPMSGIEKIDL